MTSSNPPRIGRSRSRPATFEIRRVITGGRPARSPLWPCAGDARIVSLSSAGHRLSPVIFDDINFNSRPSEPGVAYGQSKVANVLFAVEATRRWASDGITANAVQPGPVAATNLNRHLDADALATVQASAPYRRRSNEVTESNASRSSAAGARRELRVDDKAGLSPKRIIDLLVARSATGSVMASNQESPRLRLPRKPRPSLAEARRPSQHGSGYAAAHVRVTRRLR